MRRTDFQKNFCGKFGPNETWIPDTAGQAPADRTVEPLGFFVELEKWTLRRMGLKVDELDISTSFYETIKDKLTNNDLIYVVGGNTLFLLKDLK